MKLKKKTSMMLVAASAVAVAGVAAVSFAAWTGSNTQLTASASTGTVNLYGFENTTALTFDKDLVPVNQPTGTYNEATCSTVISTKLTDFTAYDAYTITVSLDTTAPTSTAEDATFKLYVKYGEQVTEVSNWSETGWTELTAGDLTFNGEKPADTSVAVTGQYLNLVLVSEYVGENNPFDGWDFELSVTLEFNS